MKNGVLQNWGLVEYKTAEDAERTLERLNGRCIDDNDTEKGIRVQFCVPGAHAINIYMNFVNNPMADSETRKRKRTPLMQDSPSDKVYDQLQSLATQNPWFVQNLNNIMATSSKKRSSLALPTASAASCPDPAQAALVLLLAGRAAASNSNNNNNHEDLELVESIVSQLRSGVSASEVLTRIAREQPHSLTSASPSTNTNTTDLNAIITSLVQSAQTILNNANNNASSDVKKAMSAKKNDPMLTDLLHASFQARLKNGVYRPNKSMTASKTIQQPQPSALGTSRPAPSTHQPVVQIMPQTVPQAQIQQSTINQLLTQIPYDYGQQQQQQQQQAFFQQLYAQEALALVSNPWTGYQSQQTSASIDPLSFYPSVNSLYPMTMTYPVAGAATAQSAIQPPLQTVKRKLELSAEDAKRMKLVG